MSETITIHIPMTFRKRGGRKLIVAPDGTILTPAPAPPVIDGALLKAVARAFRWRKLLDEGVYGSIKEVATKEKIDPSYVGDVLRLTLLAPDIIEAILDGRQPPDASVRGAAQGVSARVGGAAQSHSRRAMSRTVVAPEILRGRAASTERSGMAQCPPDRSLISPLSPT